MPSLHVDWYVFGMTVRDTNFFGFEAGANPVAGLRRFDDNPLFAVKYGRSQKIPGRFERSGIFMLILTV